MEDELTDHEQSESDDEHYPESLGVCPGCDSNITHDEKIVEITEGFNCHGTFMQGEADRHMVLFHERCVIADNIIWLVKKKTRVTVVSDSSLSEHEIETFTEVIGRYTSLRPARNHFSDVIPDDAEEQMVEGELRADDGSTTYIMDNIPVENDYS